MEDDKTPASPRKRAAKAKPTDTSNPSAASDSTTTGASRAPRPHKIPPATFVPPTAPSDQPDPGQPTADPPFPRQSPSKIAKRAPKKTASSQDQPAAEGELPAAPAQRAAKTPAKKASKKAAAPRAAAAKKTTAAPPAKAAPPQKIAEPPAIVEPAATTPAPATPAPPAPQPEASSLWSTIKTNPGYATELLALAAVSHLGPLAQADLAWLRDTYPTATTQGLVRIATSRSVRQARTQGAVAGLLGPVAVLAETGALLWTQARLVLDLAAVYGRDPADPERAAELLTLQGVHPDLTSAREALAAARKVAVNGAGASDRQIIFALVRLAGRALGRMALARRAARLVPGAGAVLTGLLDGRATEQLAVRATKFYRT
ncbi:EcsC family protein [Planosporangium flavigriseum]|uniref:EcsC protein family protein n=1 Tax=Planosporangium flavigriseum TaxID=373681 RepID=A0A8J3PP98_9ACTN|nr:EcsC family protein [Planosporangium flavigriseum]NJC67034.1 EcsC family protein [Planosporangium flavigriseum]GIG76159.1 hypothetical protein Pfl04_45630 [Planosporangium flavigriseum]